MAIKEHPIIIFLDRNGFIIYQDTLSNIWQFPFAQDLVVNLDVVNKAQLVNSIGSFIQTNKVIPSSLIVVLADSVIFQKDLSLQKNQDVTLPSGEDKIINKPQIDFGNKEQQEKEIKNFLDSVPFEEILAKVINNTRLVATNKDLLETVTHPFKKMGCMVEAIIPAFMYQQYIDFSGGLGQSVAKIVLRQTDLLKLGNMLTGQQAVEPKQDPNDQPQNVPKEKPSNSRQFILIAIFVFLIIVLVIVYLTSRSTASPPIENVLQPSESQSFPSPTVALQVKTIVPKAETDALPTTIDLRTIEIIVVKNNETEILANALKNLLTQSGFLNVNVKDSTSPIPAKGSVLFSTSIPEDARQKVIAEIKKLFPDILVQESQDNEPVITIIVGKSIE